MEKAPEDENLLKESIISNHKYNLYQQFFVVGIHPKIMYSINDCDLKSLPEQYSTPRIISKYPNENLPYLNIPDNIIASHCFPHGIINLLVECNDKDLLLKEKKIENFIFSLDNMCPEFKTFSLRTSKVYYTCLLFYENIENYRICINQRRNYNNNKEVKNKGMLIPKVICLSSFNPYYEQTKYILLCLKNYVNNYNYNNKSMENLNLYPIERIIEGLIFDLPSLPRGNFLIKLNNEALSYNNLNNKLNENEEEMKDIIFLEKPPNKNPREMINYSILMNYFRIEEIFEVIKFIILEEPILFFSEDKEVLTNVIEGLISLIYPLKYPYPVISILPEQNYSLISLFKHFIFGINYKYSEEILSKKIILDGVKFIRIIRLDKRFNNILNSEEPDNLGYSIFTSLKTDENKPLIKFNQIDENVYENDVKDTKLINDKKKINLPRHYLEKCCRKLEKNTHEKFKDIDSKYKTDNKKIITKLKTDFFNNEIRDDFVYFFCCILLKYQEYCVKYEKKIYEDKDKNGNIIEKEFEERNIQLDEKYYMGNLKLIDIFSAEEFINSTPSLDRAFYKIFFETRIFYDFMKRKIYPESNQDKFDILYFDEIINKKLSRELYIQKKETKFLEFDFKSLRESIEINSLKKDINNNVKLYLQKKENRAKALNYFQFIYLNGEDDDSSVDEENVVEQKGQIYFYYYVFPILLNDGIFYNEKYKYNRNNNIIDNIWSYLEYFTKSQQSKVLYDIFEKESSIIIDDENINKNYLLYDYSLNPTSSFHFSNDFLIKILWLIYFSKTFKYIPFSKKRYYFEIMINFLQKNKDIIDEKILLILFNSINKNGDRDMNQIFFPLMKNKTYTSYLCAREKIKSENNFIKYIINIESINSNNSSKNLKNVLNQQENEVKNENEEDKKDNKYEEKKLFSFRVNSYCTAKKDNGDICGESFLKKISDLISENAYIQFQCNKCLTEQNLIVTCKYNFDEKEEKYDINNTINFKLLSPIGLLQQDWLKNIDIDPYFICENYLECFLSAIFYFYKENLPCNFLLPNYATKSDLQEEKNNYYSIANGQEFFDEKKIKKVKVKTEPKKEIFERNFVIFDEIVNNSNGDNFILEINGKNKDLDIDNTEKILRKKDDNKNDLKSSFRKRKVSPHKKNVEFKLNLKSLNPDEKK